eukprot:447685_1
MSVSLSIGDVVFIKPTEGIETIGLIKYIGPMVDHDVMSEYVGMELVESVPFGHNGSIDGFTYFTASRGYGFHTRITNVLKKVFASDLFEQMQQLYRMLQKQSTRISKLELLLRNAKATASETPSRIDTNLRPCFSPRTNSNHSCVSRQSIQSRHSAAYSTVSSIPPKLSYKLSYQNMIQKPSNLHHTTKKQLVYISYCIQAEKATERRSSASTNSSTHSSAKRHKKHHHHKHKKKSKERRKSKLKSKSLKQKRRSHSNMYDSLESFQAQPYSAVKRRNRANTTDEGVGNSRRRASAAVYEYTTSKPMMIPNQTRSASVIYPSRSAPASPFMKPQQFNLLAPELNTNYLDANSAYSMNNLAPTQSHTQVYRDDMDNTYSHHAHAPFSPFSPYGTHSVHYPMQHIRTSSASPTHNNYESRKPPRNALTPPQTYERKAPIQSITRHASVSPYRAQLAQYNEYYRGSNVNNISTSPLTMQNNQTSPSKIYQIRENGVFYRQN